MIIPYYCEDYPEDPPEYKPLDKKEKGKAPGEPTVALAFSPQRKEEDTEKERVSPNSSKKV